MKVVVGLGKTGLSCVRYLKQKGEKVAVTDTRDDPPGLNELLEEFSDVQLALGELDSELIAKADEVVLSPGISLATPELKNAQSLGVPMVGDIELFCREIRQPIIAITGSNAKSTVTTLVGEMVHNAGRTVVVAGNIGLPVLDVLAKPERADVYVLELSSFQLETTHSLSAEVAVLLNISPDHLDRYPSMKEYTEAKHRIFRRARHTVFNADDAATRPHPMFTERDWRFTVNAPGVRTFGLMEKDGASWLGLEKTPLMPAAEVRIKGRHNQANALAALAIGNAIGLSMPAMLATLRNFAGLSHRCQWVRERNGVHWYNDSKGTNVGAAVAAIEGIGGDIRGKVVLIAGGDGKGADFVELREPAKKFVKTAVLIGRDADKLAGVLNDCCEVVRADTLQAAIEAAATVAKPGDSVLLSPACASFDMFKGYDDRGAQFMNGVNALP